MIRLTTPTQRFLRCAGSLGWAFPATLGAKCAQPDRPVIGFCGDGGFYYHLAELETAARFNISAIMLVNNNYALNQEKHLFDAAYGGRQRGRATEMWHFSHQVNFAKVAEAMGCVGIRVERADEIRPALEKALASNAPAVIEVLSDVDAMAKRAWRPYGRPAMSEFDGTVVLVTGCARARGIGRAIAGAFARAGADIVATDVATSGTRNENEEGLEELRLGWKGLESLAREIEDSAAASSRSSAT